LFTSLQFQLAPTSLLVNPLIPSASDLMKTDQNGSMRAHQLRCNDAQCDAGRLLPIFLAGSAATVLSTLVAITILPLSSLGENGWKIAAALCARHIGGAVNYVAVTAATGAQDTAVSAGLAADNLICALYFSTLYALAHGIPPDISAVAVGSSAASGTQEGKEQPAAGVVAAGAAAASAAAARGAASVAMVEGSDAAAGLGAAAQMPFDELEQDVDVRAASCALRVGRSVPCAQWARHRHRP
jgi:Protein of unknown function (DUF819)